MKNTKAFASLLNAVNKAKAGGKAKDDNVETYYPERDKAGNAFCVIRFLPAKTEDKPAFVKIFNHGFQSASGKWYIENCPTTLDGTCPLCEANGELWNTGIESNKNIVRKRSRRITYYSNILVVSDSKNPENEGKVFLFKYGQKVFDKIADKIEPQFDDEEPINPFDLEEGANFKFKIRKVDGRANYEKSEFEEVSAVGTPKEIEEVMSQLHDLEALIAPDKFKDYDTLKKRLDLVLGGTPTKSSDDDLDDDDDDVKEEIKSEKRKEEKKPAAKTPPPSGDDDDDLAYFTKLAEDESD